MKIVTSSNGKKTVRMNKKEWKSLGKKAGWANNDRYESGFGDDISQSEKDSINEKLNSLIIERDKLEGKINLIKKAIDEGNWDYLQTSGLISFHEIPGMEDTMSQLNNLKIR